MAAAGRTNASNSGLWDIQEGEGEEGHGHGAHKEPTYPILFVFAVAAIGALLRTILINSKWKPVREFPYTVLMVLIGCLAGGLEVWFPDWMGKYLKTAHLNAHAILTIFLPCLIFSSAFEMEMHIFYKSIVQVMMLAGPGTLLATGATALMVYLIWHWNILCALLFGCIVSATDPVAVVSILHSCGAPARLGVLIDGEALINDGAAIVLFTIFSLYEQNHGFQGFIYFCLVIFLSPILGFVSGYFATICIGACYNNVITETVITLSFPFVIYIIAENIAAVSGVLTVLVFGLTLAHNKTSFSPKVYPLVVHIWEYVTFLANTLIFFIVGVVIRKEIGKMAASDAGSRAGEMIVIYISVVAIRLVVIALLYPILRRTGYGINWKTALVLLWGGLRGAVGLALALVVTEYNEESHYWHLANHGSNKDRYEQILLWTMGIVFLTLVVNATTTSPLLKVLEFGKPTIAKKINMASALMKIEESLHQKTGILKNDKFLAGADWEYVQRLLAFDNMYQDDDGDGDQDDIFLDRKTTCPDCNTKVPNNPSANEISDMVEESRNRLLRLEGVSYLTQYEDGRIQQRTTHELHSRTEELAEVEEGYTSTEAVVEEKVVSNNLYAKRGVKIRRKNKAKDKHGTRMAEANAAAGEQMEDEKSVVFSVKSSTKISGEDVGKEGGRERLKKIVDGLTFEIFFLILILANMINIVWEFALRSDCSSFVLFCVDWGFLTLYILEFGMRLAAHGRDYFPRSFWGLLDLIIIIMGLVSSMSVMINPVWSNTPECDKLDEKSTKSANLSWVKILKVFRILRIVRVARFFLSEDSKWVQKIIDASYNIVMEVNVAMVTAQDDISTNIHQVPISVYKPINDVTTARIQANRFVSKSKYAKLSMERPGVEISLKTKQATAVIVDSAIQRISQLYEMGFLEDKDAEVLLDILELKKIRLKNIPASFPVPEIDEALKVVPWLDRDEEAQRFVKKNGTLREFAKGEDLNYNGTYRGIFIVVSGTVLIKGVRGLARLQAETQQYDERKEGERQPDLSGRWEESLPRKLLLRLSEPKGVMNCVSHGSVATNECRDEMLNAKFTFASRGYVVNEINALSPDIWSAVKAICLGDVVVFFISADKMKNMMKTFSCRFKSLEESIWCKLASTYYREQKRNLSDWQNLDQAFVVLIDGNGKHKLKSSEGVVEFRMDYANIQHAVLLQGKARSSAMEETVTGPHEMHHGELGLEFVSPSRADEVVGVVYVVPNSGNDVNEVFSADLETIREYAAEWIRTGGFKGSMDELLLRSVDHFDNSPDGADEDSTLYIAIKNRIKQVIAATLAVTGEQITAEDVILG